jgi:hypothetical protein
MDEAPSTRPPLWFWMLSVLAVVWSLAGISAYLLHVSSDAARVQPSFGGALPVPAAMPAWVTAAYAVSVFASLAGSIGLLLRKRWARALLNVSLIAVAAQLGWILLTRETIILGAGVLGFPALLILVPLLLVWLANRADKRGWLS